MVAFCWPRGVGNRWCRWGRSTVDAAQGRDESLLSGDEVVKATIVIVAKESSCQTVLRSKWETAIHFETSLGFSTVGFAISA